MKVVLLRPARDDLFRLLTWLEERSPQAARKASAQIRSGLADIGQFPRAGRAVGPIFRERPIRFGRDGFKARYRIATDRVEIVRLFHGRQDRSVDD